MTLSVLIKPSSEKCNLDCDYCFYHDISSKRLVKDYGFMSNMVAEKIIENAFNEKGVTNINFAFQGGEPTLIKIDFFKNFCSVVDKFLLMFDKKISYSLQTNGTLIDQEFIKLFKKYNFLIGLSIDGNKKTHDKYRKTPGGKNSFNKCIKTMKLFDENRVDYNILCVVTKDIALAPKETYQFLKKYNINFFQFIPCLDPLNELPGMKEWSLLPKDYGEFMDQLFNLWYRDFINGKKVPSIRIFDNYLNILSGSEPESCDMKGICTNQNVIEADGSVYPCDFYVLEQFSVGNVLNNSFEEIGKSQKVKEFINSSKYLPTKCKNCEYLNLCRGGCSRNRYLQDDQEVVNYYCESIYYFLSKNINKLEKMSKYRFNSTT